MCWNQTSNMGIKPIFMILFGVLFEVTKVFGNTEKCNPLQGCELCSEVESTRDYCLKTHRKRLYYCEDKSNGKRGDIFLPCEETADEELFKMSIFLFAMMLVGGTSYYFVQMRKRSSMTAFESRKANSM